jgi:Fe-S-cluster-containing dehydrogenase component
MSRPKDDTPPPGTPLPETGLPETGLSRRAFLRTGAVAASGAAALLAALHPLRDLDAAHVPSIEKLLQKHYREMSPAELQAALDRIAERVRMRFGVEATVSDPPPRDGVEFAFALDVRRCIGCRKCVHACVEENNQSRSPAIEYIRVIEMPRGTSELEEGDHHYDHEEVPAEGHYYLPVQCQQCEDPPCVDACPVEATWKESDGIVVIDYDWCIGCRYCEVACPYHARRFNFAEPRIEPSRLNPDIAYLSNRPRSVGVMEKCTFCLQRTRRGGLPACLEVCPTGARKFGDLLDPESEIAAVLRTQRVFVLKQEEGTIPRFFYVLGDEVSPPDDPVPDGDLSEGVLRIDKGNR